MLVIASITDCPDGTSPLRSRDRRARAKTSRAANDEATRPSSTRRNRLAVGAEPGDEHEGHGSDHPTEGDEGVAVQRDHGLGDRQGDHVEGAAQGEHGHGVARQVGAVEPFDDERAEQERPGGADHPTISTSFISRRKPERNSAISLRAARRDSRGSSAACTAWKRNSGMRASSTPYVNRVTSFFWSSVGQQCGRERAGVDQRGGEHRAEQQPAEVGCDLGPRRRRAGFGAQISLGLDPREPPSSGETATAKPYRPTVLTPKIASADAQHDAHRAIGAHHDRVGVEPPVAAGDAA